MADVDYKSRARAREKARKQSVWYKLVEGDNTFRLLPTPAGKKSNPVFTEYAIHRDVGPKKTQVRCGKNVEGEGDCWLCDVRIPKLQDAGNDARAKAIEPRDVFMVQVAKFTPDEDDASTGGKFEGPYLMTPGKGISDGLLRLIGSVKRNYESPSKGYNITVNRTGTGKNDTRYGAIEIDEMPSVVPKDLVAKLKPFDQLKEIPVYSEAAQKAAYQGVDYVAPEDEEEDEDEPAVRRSKKAPVDEDEETADEDVSDDLPEDDDDEEEPAPAKKKKKPAPVEDDDEEEPAPVKKKKPAPVEDDEEEPAPVKKKKKAVEEDDLSDLDMDDLENLDIEDDDVDVPPAKPAKKKAAPIEEDDEEEEPAPVKKKKSAPVEDDDEEEEPAPRKKATPPAKKRR